MTITVDRSHPGATIPDDFAGASYETSALIGGAYFRPDNAPLGAMFARLGIHHLRLGGNEADAGPLPADADITAALAFADTAGVPVIYTLRLRTYDPASAATTAHLVLDHDAARVACFSIGNEPSLYEGTYAQFRDDFDAYTGAIADARASYCGPDVFAGSSGWLNAFARDRGAALVEITAHEYFGGDGSRCVAADARDRLLSAGLLDEYLASHDAFAPAVIASSHGFRISETNSYYNGGCRGASDTFASALWGLDYEWWWATHDARGLDFHTGDHVSGSSTTYSMFVTSASGYHVRPLGYAAAAFELAAHGRLVPVTIAGSSDLTAYAAERDDGSRWVTIVDKAHGSAARPAIVAIADAATTAQVWRLEAPAIDATDGVTLGGAPIADDASWTGVPSPLEIDARGDATVTIDPASAVVVELR